MEFYVVHRNFELRERICEIIDQQYDPGSPHIFKVDMEWLLNQKTSLLKTSENLLVISEAVEGKKMEDLCQTLAVYNHIALYLIVDSVPQANGFIPYRPDMIFLTSSVGDQLALSLRQLLQEWGSKKLKKDDGLESVVERYKKLSELSFEGILIHKNGIVVDANRRFCQMFGYTLEDLKGENVLYKILHPEYVKMVRSKLDNHCIRPYEVIGIHRNGSYLNVEVEARNVTFEDKDLRVAAVRDITRKRQQEDEIKQWSDIFKHAGWGIASLNTDGLKIEFFNQAFERIFMCQENSPKGASLYNCFASTDHQKLTEGLNAAGKEGYYTMELAGKTSTGKIMPVMITLTAVKNRQKKIIKWIANIQDVTQLRYAQKAITESEEKYRSVVNSLYEGIVLYDHKGRVKAINDSAKRILGMYKKNQESSSMSGWRYHAIYEDGTAFPLEKQPAMESLRTGKARKNVIMGLNVNEGHTSWIIINSSVIREKNGKLRYVVTSFIDITKQKKIENDLRYSEEQLKNAERIGNLGSWELDIQTGKSYWSDQFYRICGYEPGAFEPTVQKGLQIIHYDDRERTMEALNEAIKNKKTYSIEKRIVQPDGHVREVLSRGIVTEGKDGKSEKLSGSFLDITDLKKAQRAVAKSEEKFRTIFELGLIGIVLLSPEYDILETNNYLSRLLGYSGKVFVRMKLGDLISSKDRVGLFRDFDAIKSGENDGFKQEIRLQDHRGFSIHTLISVRSIKNKKGKIEYYFAFIQDISNRIFAENQLKKALKKEKELNRLKSDFVSTTSHQFRTPLTAIFSSVEIMDMYLEDMTAEDRLRFNKHLQIISSEVLRLGDLMSDILTIGKIEAGKIPYAPEMHDIQLLLDEVIENNYSNLKNGRKIKVKTKGKKQDILFDRKLLGHVISNLLSNALKYSKEDPVVITHYDHENEKMRMTVEDKGIGIPQEDIKNLFQSFFRAGNVTNFSGTGLGLLIVKHFIEINKGTVSVESEENKGTKVTIELPMKN